MLTLFICILVFSVTVLSYLLLVVGLSTKFNASNPVSLDFGNLQGFLNW